MDVMYASNCNHINVSWRETPYVAIGIVTHADIVCVNKLHRIIIIMYTVLSIMMPHKGGIIDLHSLQDF